MSDATTNFATTRAAFDLPDGITYLDGNSLGPLPKAARTRVDDVIGREWGEMLIGGWNAGGRDGKGWMPQPRILGDRIARLIGAVQGTTVVGDTLSLKVYQALASALAMRPDRRVVVSDTGNFPTDLYMAEGLLRTIDKGHELVCVAPEDVADRIRDDVAVLMLTQVDYRTGRMHDMAALTQKAHEAGALVIWDLAHSAGAVPVDLQAVNADFAVGCTYKYLNGGPGAPAFITVRHDLAEQSNAALAGWMGHAQPFAFNLDYAPGKGIDRFRIGTPPVIQMAALEASLDIWDMTDMADIRAQSIALSERFIAKVEEATDLVLASPRDPQQRGSQVSFTHAEGYAVMQALIDHGVVGDFRAPDILRFGFAPLYNTIEEVDHAAATLADILKTSAWDQPQYKARKAVT